MKPVVDYPAEMRVAKELFRINANNQAILTGVDEDSFEAEVEAIRRARALQALESLQLDSLKKGTHRITADKVETEIRALRKSVERQT